MPAGAAATHILRRLLVLRLLITPADYKRLKFRIQAWKVLEEQFRALGLLPTGSGAGGEFDCQVCKRRLGLLDDNGYCRGDGVTFRGGLWAQFVMP